MAAVPIIFIFKRSKSSQRQFQAQVNFSDSWDIMKILLKILSTVPYETFICLFRSLNVLQNWAL